MNNKMIEFADKWIEKFRTSKYYEIVDDMSFPDACRSLGFEIDMGDALLKDFPKADIMNPIWMEMNECFINDAAVLGNAIFSNWRWFNHGAYSSSSLDENGNREWFICALTRLKELAAE